MSSHKIKPKSDYEKRCAQLTGCDTSKLKEMDDYYDDYLKKAIGIGIPKSYMKVGYSSTGMSTSMTPTREENYVSTSNDCPKTIELLKAAWLIQKQGPGCAISGNLALLLQGKIRKLPSNIGIVVETAEGRRRMEEEDVLNSYKGKCIRHRNGCNHYVVIDNSIQINVCVTTNSNVKFYPDTVLGLLLQDTDQIWALKKRAMMMSTDSRFRDDQRRDFSNAGFGIDGDGLPILDGEQEPEDDTVMGSASVHGAKAAPPQKKSSAALGILNDARNKGLIKDDAFEEWLDAIDEEY